MKITSTSSTPIQPRPPLKALSPLPLSFCLLFLVLCPGARGAGPQPAAAKAVQGPAQPAVKGAAPQTPPPAAAKGAAPPSPAAPKAAAPAAQQPAAAVGAGLTALSPLASPLAEWNGQYFDKKQGGLFATVKLSGFNRPITTTIQVFMEDLLQRKTFVFMLKPNNSGPFAGALAVWLATSGKYKIKQIVMVDGSGIKRTWSDPLGKQTLVVRRQCLSNLGEWSIQPVGKDSLKLAFTPTANVYKEAGPKSQSSVAAVLDGFSGLIQEAFGGKKVLKGADDSYGNTHELRRAITFTRQISMFFRLDLFRQNRYAKSVADVLTVYDANMRKCYSDRLDFNDELRGDVRFTFLLSKATGTIIKLKTTGGSINDPKLAECLYFELFHMQFSVAENLVGELVYTYDVK